MIYLSNLDPNNPMKLIVDETFVLEADQSKYYDLNMITGSVSDQYNLGAPIVELRVLDTLADSPTLDTYIDADAVGTISLSVGNILKIHNHHDTTMDFKISIIVPRKVF